MKTLKEISNLSGIAYDTLLKAARAGRLKAHRSGATWLSTRQAVEDYQSTAVLKPRGEKEMLYTEKQVRLAYFAHVVNSDPMGVESALGDLADEGECLLDKYHRAAELLKTAHLVVGRKRWQVGIAPAKGLTAKVDSPQVRVLAGWSGTHEMYRLVGLRQRQ